MCVARLALRWLVYSGRQGTEGRGVGYSLEDRRLVLISQDRARVAAPRAEEFGTILPPYRATRKQATRGGVS